MVIPIHIERREKFGQFTRNTSVEFHEGRTFFPAFLRASSSTDMNARMIPFDLMK